MMRDEDKPFICYKHGWSIKFVPRNRAGWRALGFWTLALIFPAFGLIPFAARFDDTEYEYLVLWAIVPVILATIAITFAMIRWMKPRSEVVDIDALMKIKEQQDLHAKKSGRR